MPQAELIDTSHTCYEVQGELSEERPEQSPQRMRRVVREEAGDTATAAAFIIPLRSWLHEATRKLREIRNLGPNWDSYGSPPLSESAYETAKEFLFSVLPAAPSPTIVPVSGGGVQFEWQVSGRELEIEFCPDSRIEYLRVDEDETTDEGEIPSMNATRLQDLLKWLSEGQQPCETS